MLAWLKQHHRRWLPVLFVGVLAILLALFPPRWGFRLANWVAPGAVYFLETAQPTVALTIDDGPSAGATPQILDVLDQFGATATFFLLTDNIANAPTQVPRLVNDDHELGNHLTTDEASIRLSPSDFEQRLYQADAVLSAYGPVQWLRPGMGWYNPRMVQAAAQAGYRLALGSVFPYDTHIPWVGFITWFIQANVQPGDIIVLHDGPERGQRTAAALAQLLPRLQARGYRIVTLSALFDAAAQSADAQSSMAFSHHSTSQ